VASFDASIKVLGRLAVFFEEEDEVGAGLRVLPERFNGIEGVIPYCLGREALENLTAGDASPDIEKGVVKVKCRPRGG